MKNLIASVTGALACLLAAPAFAQTPELIAKYDEAVIARVAGELDMVASVVIGLDQDTPSTQLLSYEDLIFFASGTNCAGAGAQKTCTAILLFTNFDLASEEKAQQLAKKIDAEYVVGKAWTEGARLVVGRYLILDGGITLENLKAELSVFEELGYIAWELTVG